MQNANIIDLHTYRTQQKLNVQGNAVPAEELGTAIRYLIERLRGAIPIQSFPLLHIVKE